MGLLLQKLTIALIFIVPVAVTIAPASGDPGPARQLNEDNFYLIPYSRETITLENGRWVVKKRANQYRIIHGDAQGRYVSLRPSTFVLYTRSSLEGHARDNCWTRHVVRTRVPGEATPICRDGVAGEKLLFELLSLLGAHAAKAAQIMIHHSSQNINTSDPQIEIWLQPKHWNDFALHKSVLATLRASTI